MSLRKMALIVLMIAIIGSVMLWRYTSRSERLLGEIRLAAEQNRFADVIDLSETIVNDGSASVQIRAMRGHAFRRLGKLIDALKEYDFISDDGSSHAIQARWESAEILLQDEGHPSKAVDQLRRLLTQDSHNGPARVQFAALLAMAGRNWEASEVRMDLIRDGIGSARELVLLGLDDLSVENLDRLNEFRKSSPDDVITRMAEAYSVLREMNFNAAERLYQQLSVDFPDQVEAHVRLGALLVQRQAKEQFLQWHKQLPASVETHPDLWEVRGDFARMEQDIPGAIRCYWEAVKRNPAHRRALHRLGLLLKERNEREAGAAFLPKAAKLLDVQVAAKRFHVHPVRERALEASEYCSRAGLQWEAWGWSQVGRDMLGAERTLQRPDSKQPRMDPSTDPANRFDLSNHALPAWILDRSSRDAASAGTVVDRTEAKYGISFEDASSQVGFKFQYYSGDDPATPEHLPFQFTGGGVAVLDYDLDHWPDVFLTQGNDFPKSSSQGNHTDALFRNQIGREVVNVAQLAGVADAGYGQGATVGDIDNDGFPDLYVANLEGGRLYRNNGDGTFRDITTESKIDARQWTTSCLLADVNHDGYPDLYLVNYLEGKDLYHTICRTPDGRPRVCTPYDFNPAQDKLWINSRDGTFTDVTTTSGIVHSGGNGLGIVAMQDTQSDRLNLFVANDTTANFWFVNQSHLQASPLFDEQGLSAGLAFDRDGRAQACMGVAAGDADGDGRLDLFVTNFYDESNTLYLQRSQGLFDDVTARSGLRDPSLKLLGFGTQFLDADLDGWLDLVVTNGHVDPVQSVSVPSAMRPQFYRNLGKASYVLMTPDSVGEWFAKEQRGRGLARIDWNGDGKEEFVVSHLDSAASLMRNTSQSTGSFVKFKLVGTRLSRDAIGTTIRLFLKDRVLTRQMTAGDGYQASNERSLVFGLTNAAEPINVDVFWPSGEMQRFTAITPGSTNILIEGRDTVVLSEHH